MTMQAISQHDNDTVDVLLRAKANITEDVSKIGYLPLHVVAAQFDNAVAVIMLLKAGANVNAVGRNKQTPLMEAIKKRSSRTSSAETVLAHFAKENVENVHPRPPSSRLSQSTAGESYAVTSRREQPRHC